MLKYILLVGALSICRETSGQKKWPKIFGTKNRVPLIPTVLPASPFNPSHTCEILKPSMKGMECDSETILKIIATHTYNQRYEIAATYKTMYNQDLLQKLFTEYDGNILDVIQFLFWPTEKMYARQFRDTSGFFRDLLLELIKGREPDNSPGFTPLPSYAVDELNGLGRGQWSNNKDKIFYIFCEKAFSELANIFAEYEHQNGHKIEEDIENEFSSDVKRTLLAIVKCTRNRPQFFAEQLNMSMSNFGINHNVLHRIIVGRSEIDLGNIKEEFAKINGSGINVWLKSAIEGNYWSLIVQLAGYAPEYFKD